MNLHGTVRGIITSVNPDIEATYLASTGNTVDAAGNQTPGFAAPVTVNIQVQPLTGPELEHINQLNIQGVIRAVYLYGNANGIVRTNQQGGDIFEFPLVEGGPVKQWRVIEVMETWPSWSRVAVWLQQ